MKTTRIREKIKKFLGVRPRNTAEILEYINSTMRHGTTSQQLGNVLSKDKDIVKVGYIKRSGILSGGYDNHEWATRQWVEENVPEWIEGTPLVVDTERNIDGTASLSSLAETSKKVSNVSELDLEDVTPSVADLDKAVADFEAALRNVSEEILERSGRPGRLSDLNERADIVSETDAPDEFHKTLLGKNGLMRTLEDQELEYKMNRDWKIRSEEILLNMQNDGMHEQETKKLKQMLGDFLQEEIRLFEDPWTIFPLTPNHLDLHPEFQFQRFKNAEQMINHHLQRSQNLQEFCRGIKKRFQMFPFSWLPQDFSMLRSMYSQCRMVAGARERGDDMNEWLSEVVAEYHQTPMDSDAPSEEESSSHEYDGIHQTDVKSLDSSLNYVLLFLGQLCQQKEVSSLAAIHFSTSLEQFHLTKSRMHFLQLLDSFEALTKPRSRGSFLDDVPKNVLHPCFAFDDPVFGTHLFMNMAVMDMVRQNPSILGEKRMEPFLTDTPGSILLDKNLFEHKVACSNGTRSIHQHDSATSKFWDIRDHYRSLLDKNEDSFENIFVQLSKKKKERLQEDQPDAEVLILYDEFPEFEDVEHHQYAFRHNIVNKFQARTERKARNKHSEREFLSCYGDMSVPNPLRSFDSDVVGQLPQNALEAIERVSTNMKNQGLRTQNRLVCFLDMVWANLHRRESFGNRFVGLDLLEEIDLISSTMHETHVAELLLFHQQKILRLYEKPGKEDLSRTNKMSRNNLYARILHQFRLFLEEPTESIDHLARPPSKSSLRRLLHPIRLQTGKDLPLDDQPYDVVLSIALSRMSTLIDALEEVFQIYMWRLTDLSNTDRYNAPSHVHGAMFRSLAVMLCLEVCQVHMMVQYLGRGKKWKKSHMYYNQTKLAVEGNGFDAIKDDFVADIRFDGDAYKDGTESIATVLEGEGVTMPLELLQRLNHYCYSTWGASDETRKSLTQDELKLVASMNLFVHNDEPTGMDYVQLVRDFDRLYVNHGPKFMSPGRFAFNSFEYF